MSVRLSDSGAGGLSGTDNVVTFQILVINQPPPPGQILFTPPRPTEGGNTTFEWTGLSPGATYCWRATATVPSQPSPIPNGILCLPDHPTFQATFPDNGEYNVSVEVTNRGDSVTGSTLVAVDNVPPTISSTPVTAASVLNAYFVPSTGDRSSEYAERDL